MYFVLTVINSFSTQTQIYFLLFFLNIKPFITMSDLKIVVARPADLEILVQAYIEGYDFEKYKVICHQKAIEKKYLRSL